ncbi:hypothetical protein TNCT_568431, partial [Trichonephila clavata]
ISAVNLDVIIMNVNLCSLNL